MRITIRAQLLAVVTLLNLVFLSDCYAISDAPCMTGSSCGPCGYTPANVTNIPSDASSLNPLVNYTASSELVKCRGYFGGFYLGTAFGLGDINYHYEIAGNTPFQLDNDARTYFVTVVNGGFNLVLDYFFLGAEVGYNYRSRNNPISYYDASDVLISFVPEGPDIITFASSFPCKVRLDINSQHAATADLLPGFVINRFVGYLRLGVEQTQYDWQRRVCFPLITINTLTDNSVFVQGQEFVDSRKKSTTGYRLGAGFGVAAGPHVSFHLNYIHTFGSKLNITPNVSAIATSFPVIIAPGVPTVVVNLSELASNTTIEPQRDEVTLGVKFRF